MDTQIGFWIENLPYIWIDGGSYETSYRFYMVQENSFIIYDSEGLMTSMEAIRTKNKETFSIYPFSKKCDKVRNYFLVYIYDVIPQKLEDINLPGLKKIRKNGKDIAYNSSLYYPAPNLNHYIIYPEKKKFMRHLPIGFLRWGGPFMPITYNPTLDKSKKFEFLGYTEKEKKEYGVDAKLYNNLYELSKTHKLTNDVIAEIHLSALKKVDPGVDGFEYSDLVNNPGIEKKEHVEQILHVIFLVATGQKKLNKVRP